MLPLRNTTLRVSRTFASVLNGAPGCLCPSAGPVPRYTSIKPLPLSSNLIATPYPSELVRWYARLTRHHPLVSQDTVRPQGTSVLRPSSLVPPWYNETWAQDPEDEACVSDRVLIGAGWKDSPLSPPCDGLS
jgi:hypothetical protein